MMRNPRCDLLHKNLHALVRRASPASTGGDWTERHCAQVRGRILRNGVLVVCGSVLASLLFVQLSFELAGDVEYEGSMQFALLIPLVVASAAYSWIAALTLRLERSNAALDRLAHTDPLSRTYPKILIAD